MGALRGVLLEECACAFRTRATSDVQGAFNDVSRLCQLALGVFVPDRCDYAPLLCDGFSRLCQLAGEVVALKGTRCKLRAKALDFVQHDELEVMACAVDLHYLCPTS